MKNKKSERKVECWRTGLTEEEYKRRRQKYEDKHPECFSWEGVDTHDFRQVDTRAAQHKELYAKEFVEGEEKICYVCKRKEGTPKHWVTKGTIAPSTGYWNSTFLVLGVEPVMKKFARGFVNFNLCDECRVLFGLEDDPEGWLRKNLEGLRV
ncbi:MAG: hypothetical protein ACE5HY_06435 [Candidatus Hydrothermarchaeales archaeon]